MALSVISMKACCSVSLGVSKFGTEHEAMKTTNTRYDVTANILEVVRIGEFSIQFLAL